MKGMEPVAHAADDKFIYHPGWLPAKPKNSLQSFWGTVVWHQLGQSCDRKWTTSWNIPEVTWVIRKLLCYIRTKNPPTLRNQAAIQVWFNFKTTADALGKKKFSQKYKYTSGGETVWIIYQNWVYTELVLLRWTRGSVRSILWDPNLQTTQMSINYNRISEAAWCTLKRVYLLHDSGVWDV